jgi:IS1 family transposase
MPVWTAYSRREKRVIEFEVSNKGIDSCRKIEEKAVEAAGRVKRFFSDANSCYEVTFDKYFERERLGITKSQTHLIESSNSSIRDNLARFNRRSKRYSKSIEMLYMTLYIFFNKLVLGQMFNISMCP